MTVLDKRAASGIETKGLWKYLVVAVLAVAIGVGSGLAVNRLVEASSTTIPASYARYGEVGEHIDEVWNTGLAQSEAIRADQTGAMWRRAAEMRGAAMDDHIDRLRATGEAQAAAIKKTFDD